MRNQELLSKINDITIKEKFPFQLIDDSCFYFGSAFDGDCMWYCNDSYERYEVDSYVYCDYGDTDYINLENAKINARNIRGYRLLGAREVDLKELGLTPGKVGEITTQQRRAIRVREYNVTDPGKQRFAYWSVYEKSDPDMRGPQYFSLLFILGEGAITYTELYWNTKCSAKILCKLGGAYGTILFDKMIQLANTNPCG